MIDKPKPELQEATDAIVRVTIGSICSSDLHIKHGSVPRAVPGITVGHEMVGGVEAVGADVKGVKVGDRVTVNVETFCGECFYCRHGYVNNCTSPHGGWALGCRIDGGQTEYVRVPLASQGLNRIPDSVTDDLMRFTTPELTLREKVLTTLRDRYYVLMEEWQYEKSSCYRNWNDYTCWK